MVLDLRNRSPGLNRKHPRVPPGAGDSFGVGAARHCIGLGPQWGRDLGRRDYPPMGHAFAEVKPWRLKAFWRDARRQNQRRRGLGMGGLFIAPGFAQW